MPNAAPIEIRFMSAALSGTSDRAEGEQQQQEAQPDDDRDHQRQLVGDLVGEVDVAGRGAADVRRSCPCPWSPCGIVLSRRSLTRSSVASIGRRGRRRSRCRPRRAVVVDQRLCDRLDARGLLHVGPQRLQARIGGRVLGLLAAGRRLLALLCRLLLGLLLGLLLRAPCAERLLRDLLLLVLLLLLLVDVVDAASGRPSPAGRACRRRSSSGPLVAGARSPRRSGRRTGALSCLVGSAPLSVLAQVQVERSAARARPGRPGDDRRRGHGRRGDERAPSAPSRAACCRATCLRPAAARAS